MKRFAAAMLAFVLIIGFAGCSKKAEYAVSVSGACVPEGVYAYYFDKALSYPDEYGAKAGDAESAQNAALKKCSEYTALVSFLANNGITLEYYLKSEAAQETESIWSLFGEYYKKIGVSKQDITKIMTFEKGKEQLVLYYYGENGKNPVSQDDLKQEFVELYVGFKGFECRLTKENANGETVEMSDSEKEETENQLRELAAKVDGGTDIDTVYEQYCSDNGLVATGELEVNITKQDDPMYDDDFFSKVSTISHGRAAIVKTGLSIYVVQRSTIATSDDDAFALYKTEVLNQMKLPSVESKLEKLAAGYTVETDRKKLDKINNAVMLMHTEQEEAA